MEYENQRNVINENINFPEIADGEDKSSPFKNCLRKNYRHIRKWAKRTKTNAFRLYDRDVKGYPVAIDFYDNRFCIQFFSKNPAVEEPPQKLQEFIVHTLFDLFKVSEESIHWKTRKRQAPMEQYEKIDHTRDFFTIFEYGLKFKVNLHDYLDTGLFLDHRETRHIIGEMSQGKRVLNLFAYTCAFSIHAAAGGATFTKSVDMSNTYTSWGKENFHLNSLPLKNNVIIRADCLKFLEEEVKREIKYDIIIIDPPTISRSKKMDRKFNVQLDYIFLISKALKLLSSGGVIFFSTNSRKFNFDNTEFASCSIEDISKKTIPLDIRNEKIHSCWKISLK
jgi:23S rRNA (cytosine1962-C5)-methyltransferase